MTTARRPRAVTLAPFGTADLVRLRDWFNEPHVYEWWGPAATSDGLGGAGADAATLEQVTDQYGASAAGQHLNQSRLIVADADPVGFLQWYDLTAYPDYAAWIGEPAGVAVDLLVGAPDRVGQGIGPRALDTLARDRFAAGVPRVVAGPDVRNRRSIGAFTRAGFRWARDAWVPGEPAPEHVMVRDRDDAAPSLG